MVIISNLYECTNVIIIYSESIENCDKLLEEILVHKYGRKEKDDGNINNLRKRSTISTTVDGSDDSPSEEDSSISNNNDTSCSVDDFIDKMDKEMDPDPEGDSDIHDINYRKNIFEHILMYKSKPNYCSYTRPSATAMFPSYLSNFVAKLQSSLSVAKLQNTLKIFRSR